MKRIYLLVAGFVAGLTLNAQLTQANHAFATNDMWKMYQCDSTSINPGASGAGAIWNFGTITTHSSILTSYTAAAVTTTAFPTASIAVASSTADISYYSSNANGLYYSGGNIVVNPVSASLTYTAPAVYAAYPMSLNTTSSSVTGGSINVTSPTAATGTFAGNCTVLADGTGTLNLPGGVTFSNVTRVVTTQTINFNALVTGTVIQKNYEYFDPSTKGPLFSIKMATVSTAFTSPSTQTFVSRAKTTTTTTTTGLSNESVSNINLTVYPNPSNAFVNFAITTGNASKLMVYDITGKLVDTRAFTDGKVKLDVSTYNTGLYIYTVTAEDGRKLKSGKITVAE